MYSMQLCPADSGSGSPEPPTVTLLFRKAKFMLYSMGRCQAVYLKNQSRKLCSAYACSQVTQFAAGPSASLWSSGRAGWPVLFSACCQAAALHRQQ